jgi:hypothetical protein
MYSAEIDAALDRDERNAAFLPLGEQGVAKIDPANVAQSAISADDQQPESDKDAKIKAISEALGLDERLLRDLTELQVDERTKNEFGRFDRLIESVDFAKAKAYFEQKEGATISDFQTNVKIYDLLEDFVLKGEFDESIEPQSREAVDVPAKPDFDAVAQTVYDRVMADDNFAYHLQFAQSRGSLRSPLNAALDKVIGELKEESDVYVNYFDDDVSDDLFDHVYRAAWANRPQPETEKKPESRQATGTDKPPTPRYDVGDFVTIEDTRYRINEIADGKITLRDIRSDEFASSSLVMGIEEFERIINENPLNLTTMPKAETPSEAPEPAQQPRSTVMPPVRVDEPEQTVKPPESYIAGSRFVLDLRDMYKNPAAELDEADFTGEFTVDEISNDYVTVSKGELQLHLTREEVVTHTVEPIAERVYQETGTDYYLFRYPDGIDAGAELSHDELRLITEKADNYVLCAEACFLSDEEMEQWGVTFRKMPRDFGLLPEAAQVRITELEPKYQEQWQEQQELSIKQSRNATAFAL